MSATGGKRCVRCGSLQPLYRFEADEHAKDGKASWCVDCRKEYKNQVNRASKSNREWERARHRNNIGLVGYYNTDDA